MSEIIVSLTSYPARIKTVDRVLDSIIRQTILPVKIVLFLSADQFHGYKGFPDFSQYEKFGFEICWKREDLGPHKKYYYAMQQYPDNVVITIDDDIYYKETMIEELLKYHKKYPHAVITRRAHLVTWMENGCIAPYEKWYFENFTYIGIPRMDLVATGCSGILYPPHIFKPELFNKDLFMEKAPYADDLWLKVMELYSEIPVVLARHYFEDSGLENYCENGLYRKKNINGGNDIQLHALLEYYGKDNRENFLLMRMSAQGKLMLDECKKVKENDICTVMDKYLQVIDNQETVLIYGAGNIAGKLYKAFEKTNRLKKIRAFIVKHVEENERDLSGIEVKDYMGFVDSIEKIIIGLSAIKQEEVYKDLIAKGFKEERIIKLSPFINKIIEDF